MGDLQIPQMEVRPYLIFGHMFWGYLKFRPELQVPEMAIGKTWGGVMRTCRKSKGMPHVCQEEPQTALKN